MTAEQIIAREGLSAMTIKTMAQMMQASPSTLKRWAIRDHERFAHLVAECNDKMVEIYAENIVGALLTLLGPGYSIGHDVVGSGSVKLVAHRSAVHSAPHYCAYDTPRRALVEVAHAMKEQIGYD